MTTREQASLRAQRHLQGSAEVKQKVRESCLEEILAAADLIADTFRAGGRLFLCGNGGSAADCQHMAAEFVSRLNRDFDRPGLPAIALTTDTSFLTAYSNDISFEGVFERQIQALGRAGDALIGISTSGSSRNVLLAIDAARALRMRTVGLGGAGGPMRTLVDVAIAVPSSSTQHIQEAHLTIEHILCDLVEQALFAPEALDSLVSAPSRASGS